MRGLGFEPRNALSNESLNLARLTAPASPRIKRYFRGNLKVWLGKINFKD